MLSFFDSPIEFCSVQRKFVKLDQVQRSCARRENCVRGQVCPLYRLFRRNPCGTVAIVPPLRPEYEFE